MTSKAVEYAKQVQQQYPCIYRLYMLKSTGHFYCMHEAALVYPGKCVLCPFRKT